MKVTTAVLAITGTLSHSGVFAQPTLIQQSVLRSTSPFHDCLERGYSFHECRRIIYARGAEVDAPSSTSPFHDCLGSGKTWAECSRALDTIRTSEKSVTSAANTTLVRRDTQLTKSVTEAGKEWHLKADCYSGDIAGAGWLANTAVKAVAKEACTQALQEAVQAGTTAAIGTFTKKVPGFYQGLYGPIVKPSVGFLLSTYLPSDWNDKMDPKTLGQSLCQDGIDFMVGTAQCTTARKVGPAITSHTSVNGGKVDFTLDGNDPDYRDDGSCPNCVLSLILEAADKVNIGGTVIDNPMA